MDTLNFQNTVLMNIEVKTYDIDLAGHVNNLVYVRWLEDLRNELFAQIYPLEELIKLNYYPVIISNEMKYKSQIKLFDQPVGRISLESYSHGVITLNAEILNKGKISFQATQRCVLMHLQDHKMFKGSFDRLVSYKKK
jgi:acyl-CoA thioester hydrolase